MFTSFYPTYLYLPLYTQYTLIHSFIPNIYLLLYIQYTLIYSFIPKLSLISFIFLCTLFSRSWNEIHFRSCFNLHFHQLLAQSMVLYEAHLHVETTKHYQCPLNQKQLGHVLFKENIHFK